MRNIKVLGKDYTYGYWSGYFPDGLQNEPGIALDTETHMVVEGQPIVPVIMQVCFPRRRHIDIVKWEDFDRYIAGVYCRLMPSAVVAMHTAGFDLQAVNHPLLWEAADKGRIVDVAIRWMHKRLSEGRRPPDAFGLARMAKELLGIDLDKNEDVRLCFSRDADITEEQLLYAALDAIVTALLVSTMPEEYPGEQYQTKGYIALKVSSDNGMLVDKAYRPMLVRKFEDKILEAQQIVHLFGVYPGDSKDTGQRERIREILQAYEFQYDVKFPRTEKTKDISLNKEVDAVFAVQGLDVPAFLRNYQNLTHYQKIVETYLTDKHIGQDGRVHPFWIPVLKTARASARRPNTTNLPRAEDVRAIYTAPKGCVLAALDYSQMELCMLAESCYQFYKESVMREVINSGVDLHSWFGDRIREAYCSEEDIDFRQLAKAANFGFPGGLGVKTFIAYARNTWGVPLTEEQAKVLKDLWLDSFPEMRFHLKPVQDDKAVARRIYEICSEVFPKNMPFAKTVEDLKSALAHMGHSPEQIDEITQGINRYIARTITGRIRPNVSFCEACNYVFQSSGADGTKLAAYNVMRGGYKIVNYVHDELIIELPYDDRMEGAVIDIADIMRASMQKISRNTAIKVDFAVMKSWSKAAKEVRDASGKLTMWSPDIRKALDIEIRQTKEEHRHIAEHNTPLSRPLYKADGSLFGFQPLKTVMLI